MNLFIRQARPPEDQEVTGLLSRMNMGKLVSFLNKNPKFDEFYRNFHLWAQTSSKVTFAFGGEFVPLFSAGVTEAFNNFYIQHPDKSLFLLRGEYPYHRDVFDSLQRPYHWYGEEEMNSNSMLIISSPFSGTGNYEEWVLDVLKDCDTKKIPVMIDFAFLGLGESLDMRKLVSFSCVEQFSFSFSKMFGIGKFRAGICWMRRPRGALHVVNSWNYINWPAVYVVNELMNHFSFDYMAQKYKPLQEEICKEHGLKPSGSYLFGLGGKEYDQFSRDGKFNRVCLSPIFNQRSL